MALHCTRRRGKAEGLRGRESSPLGEAFMLTGRDNPCHQLPETCKATTPLDAAERPCDHLQSDLRGTSTLDGGVERHQALTDRRTPNCRLRTLVEQLIGRVLRLPHGHRTGTHDVDRLTIVAHPASGRSSMAN